ncbi:MAG: hypothetical protein IRZ28_11230 [Steroidobacteraceae bacterium]|nr:hypothetical protein [Steroidobacteraceae bacterium]
MSAGIVILSVLVAGAALAAARDIAATLAVIAGGVAAAAYLAGRIWRAVRIVELLVSLEAKLDTILDRLDRLEQADDQQAEDHAEVKQLLSAADERLQRVETLSRRNDERLVALARDLGVTYRDAA